MSSAASGVPDDAEAARRAKRAAVAREDRARKAAERALLAERDAGKRARRIAPHLAALAKARDQWARADADSLDAARVARGSAVLAARAEGVSPSEIAEALACSVANVFKIMEVATLGARRPKKRRETRPVKQPTKGN